MIERNKNIRTRKRSKNRTPNKQRVKEERFNLKNRPFCSLKASSVNRVKLHRCIIRCCKSCKPICLPLPIYRRHTIEHATNQLEHSISYRCFPSQKNKLVKAQYKGTSPLITNQKSN